MEENPEAIVDMVRKLYVIERAIPELSVPSLRLTDTDDGRLVVDFDGDLDLLIGTDEYNIDYSITLQPQVVRGYEPPSPLSAAWIVTGGVVLFCAGLIAGLLIQ